MYKYEYTSVFKCVCTYAHMCFISRMNVWAYMYIYIFIDMYVYTYICMYTYIYVCIHEYTYLNM